MQAERANAERGEEIQHQIFQVITQPAATLIINFEVILLMHIFRFPGGVPGNKHRYAKDAGKYQPGQRVGK